jgi:hypothetical protein
MLKSLGKERYDEGNKKLEEIELKYCITKDYHDGLMEEMKASKYTIYKGQNQDNKIMFIYNGDFKKVCEDMINLGFGDYMKNHYLPHYAKLYNQIMQEREYKESKPFNVAEVIRKTKDDKQDIQKEIEVKPYFQQKEEVKPQKKIEEKEENKNQYVPQKKEEEKTVQNNKNSTAQMYREISQGFQDFIKHNQEPEKKIEEKPYIPQKKIEEKNESKKIYPINPYQEESTNHKYFGTGSALDKVNTKTTYEKVTKRTKECKKDHDNSIEEIELKKETKNVKNKNQKIYPSNSYEEESSDSITMKKEDKYKRVSIEPKWYRELQCCCPCIRFS